MSRATRELLGPSSCDATCGRQVFPQKVTRVTRPPPLRRLSAQLYNQRAQRGAQSDDQVPIGAIGTRRRANMHIHLTGALVCRELQYK